MVRDEYVKDRFYGQSILKKSYGNQKKKEKIVSIAEVLNQLVLNSVMIELMTNKNIHERRLSDTQFSQRRVGCGSLIRACLNILAVFVFVLFFFFFN